MRKIMQYTRKYKAAQADDIKYVEATAGFQFVNGDEISFVSGTDFKLTSEE